MTTGFFFLVSMILWLPLLALASPTPNALREAVQEHGALRELVEWVQLLGVVAGVTAGFVSAVAAWSLGSWSGRVAGFFAGAFVAPVSAVTFGSWI